MMEEFKDAMPPKLPKILLLRREVDYAIKIKPG